MFIRVLTIIAMLIITGCAHNMVRPGDTESGLASYYANSLQGHRTASGERYNNKLFTAAHRTWPIGSRVEVLNKDNGRKVDVRINDRGPFVDGHIIDLSHAAAKALGLLSTGVANVEIRLLAN